MALAPTFVYEGKTVLAFIGDEVVASGEDIEQVEREARERVASRREAKVEEDLEGRKRAATHITTPNGVKGQLLGRVPDMWGEKVIARLENGQISEFYTTGHEQWINESKTASTSGVEGLRSRLNSEYPHDKHALVARIDELKAIRHEAGSLIIKGASYLDETQLDQIRVLADAELAEVGEALDHLNQVDDAIAPPTPAYQVAEQATVGVRDDSAWLENAAQEMEAENQGQDFEQLLDEGPLLLVSEMDDAALADAGTVREVALSHITSKTAGVYSDQMAQYRNTFLARVEEERRVQLQRRSQETHTKTAATIEDDSSVPDEALFS